MGIKLAASLTEPSYCSLPNVAVMHQNEGKQIATSIDFLYK